MSTPASHEPPPGLPDQSADGPVGSGDRTVDRSPAAGLDRHGRVRRTRASGLWVGMISVALLALAFLIFIAQNSEPVTINFLGFEGEMSLAIALLLSAVTGILLVAVPGAVRITQLRRALKKNARA
ncbi:lipopolysaccharide assembly protein LapA domain-containing protein [Aeromicrobium sp.]|uniref:LapA family protein n=1 Tax=Aeromicrobium sp. TaxID=1871063 RepID=UPI0030BBB97B